MTRMVKHWKRLPEEALEYSSLEIFKDRLGRNHVHIVDHAASLRYVLDQHFLLVICDFFFFFPHQFFHGFITEVITV